MNTLNRRMFRKKGGGASGIMASGPELVKRTNGGGFRDPYINYQALIPNPIEDARGLYGKNLNLYELMKLRPKVEPIEDQIAIEKEKKRKEDLIKKDIDTINVTNEKLLKSGAEVSKPVTVDAFPKSRGLSLKTDEMTNDPMPGGLFSQDNIVTEAEAEAALKTPTGDGISDAYDPEERKKQFKGLTGNLAKMENLNQEILAKNRRAISDQSSYDDRLFFGTTLNKATEDLQNELNKEGQEITLADVRDQGVKLLGYDPDKLDENFDEDRRSAFFLSLMKAGLAIAAGESDNALTNIAKGLNFGLTAYGEDVKDLKKELKQDRKDAANTFYKLLGDKKSEQLAKESLNLKKKMALREIVATKVGDERALAIKEMEMENRNAELKINFYKILNEQNRHEQNFDLKERELEANVKNAMLRLVPDKLRLFQGSGEITLIDQTKGFTLDNIKISDKLKKVFMDELTNLKTNKKLAKQLPSLTQKQIGEEEQYYGIVKGETSNKKFGTFVGNFETNLNKKVEKGEVNKGILNDYFNVVRTVNGKINLSRVPSAVKKYILKDAVKILNTNKEIFNLKDPEADAILNPPTQE